MDDKGIIVSDKREYEVDIEQGYQVLADLEDNLEATGTAAGALPSGATPVPHSEAGKGSKR